MAPFVFDHSDTGNCFWSSSKYSRSSYGSMLEFSFSNEDGRSVWNPYRN